MTGLIGLAWATRLEACDPLLMLARISLSAVLPKDAASPKSTSGRRRSAVGLLWSLVWSATVGATLQLLLPRLVSKPIGANLDAALEKLRRGAQGADDLAQRDRGVRCIRS